MGATVGEQAVTALVSSRMTGNDEPKSEPTPSPERQRAHLPPGYREGIITAITVLLGFSLAFFRFWGFEAEGQWSSRSVVAAGILIVADADHRAVSLSADCR